MRMEKNANSMSYLQWKNWHDFLRNTVKEKDELKRIMDQKNREHYSHGTKWKNGRKFYH